MKRSSVLKLKQEVWVFPIEDDPLEVAVVPAAASELASVWSGADGDGLRSFCTNAFVNFRGYTEDDGTPVRNTLDARMELFAVLPVRRAVVSNLQESAEIQAEGEESADSD